MNKKYKGKIFLKRHGWFQLMGYDVDLGDGFTGFVHKNIAGKDDKPVEVAGYIVTDKATGYAFGDGKTEKAAIEKAKDNLSNFSPKGKIAVQKRAIEDRERQEKAMKMEGKIEGEVEKMLGNLLGKKFVADVKKRMK